MSDTLKPTAQCQKAARTAQAVLGQISRAFHFRDRHVFMRLYAQYVRPHLEFSTQAWSPWTEADKAVLEKVQRKAVGMVSGLVSREYKDRLEELNMESLEERRHQADMHMVHKIMREEGGLHHSTWFEKASKQVRVTRVAADNLNVSEERKTRAEKELFQCAGCHAVEQCASAHKAGGLSPCLQTAVQAVPSGQTTTHCCGTWPSLIEMEPRMAVSLGPDVLLGTLPGSSRTTTT